MPHSPMRKHLLNTSRDGDSTTSLGSLFKCLTDPLFEEILSHVQVKAPLLQHEIVLLHPVGHHEQVGRYHDLKGTQTPTQGLTEDHEILAKSSLQAKLAKGAFS